MYAVIVPSPYRLEAHMGKEQTIVGSNGVWLVRRAHVSKKNKQYKRTRKIASPNRSGIRGRDDD